jgi:hypothetical protein
MNINSRLKSLTFAAFLGVSSLLETGCRTTLYDGKIGDEHVRLTDLNYWSLSLCN